jgi:hypothetical protein
MASQAKMANSQKNKKSVSRQKTRQRPKSSAAGEYYHIEVLPKTDFVNFQTQAVGRGRIQRVAGQRSSGYWSTVKWMIEQLGSEPVRKLGDLFKARPRPSFLEQTRPTRNRQRVRRDNTKKSQAGRRKN